MNEGLVELSKYVFRFEAPCLLSFHVIMGLHLLIKKAEGKGWLFRKIFLLLPTVSAEAHKQL